MSPRSDLSNQKIRDDRREQILHGALKVFAYKGFKPAKISDIAAEVNISQGLVNHYFNSKDEIFIAVVERALLGALSAFDEDENLAISPWEHLLKLTERMLQGMSIHPEYMLVMIQSLVSQDVPPQTGRLLGELGLQFNQRLVEMIKDGQEVGQVVEGDPQALANAFIALIQGLAINQYSQGFANLLPSSSDSSQITLEIVLRLLKA
jgi:AcrR family transcriptional regulator